MNAESNSDDNLIEIIKRNIIVTSRNIGKQSPWGKNTLDIVVAETCGIPRKSLME